MKDIVIIGAGGFAREVTFLIESNNEIKKEWNIVGFIDNSIPVGELVLGYPVIGNDEWILKQKQETYVVCAVGKPEMKLHIVEKISKNINIFFPNIISNSAIFSKYIHFGQGIIICAGSILTVDITIEDFVTINLDCTIGHDAIIEKYSTLHPSVNVSGNVKIGRNSEIGTGTSIIQGVDIGENVIIGAGTVVIKSIESNCTVVGNPGKKIK